MKCAGCGGEVPPTRRKWCSDTCWEKNKPVLTRREGYIYLIYAPEVHRFKIGFSWDVEDRLYVLRGEAPCELELLAYFPGTRMDEKSLHSLFAPHCHHGEWFFGEVLPQALAHFEACTRASHVKTGPPSAVSV